MIKNTKWLLIASLAFAACSSDDNSNTTNPDNTPVTAGSADFTTFVALGNSLTAGFSDNALFIAGQNNAYPKLMSEQFALVGGGEFKTPFMNDNIGGLLLGGNQITSARLIFNGTGPVALPGVPTTEITQTLTGPFNNMGVPGAKSFHLLAPSYGDASGVMNGSANPYFVRFRSNPTTTVLADALAQNPTFFSLWIGNNDVLGYASTGGDGTNPITNDATFTAAYNTLVQELSKDGRKGIVANIPDIATAPHFNVVPFNPLDSNNPAFGPMIPTLNATFAQLNLAYAFLGQSERAIVFNTNGKSAMVIHDESLPNIAQDLMTVLMAGGVPQATAGLLAQQFGQSRQATAKDKFVLGASSVIATVNTTRYAQLIGAGVDQATAGQLSVNGVTFPLEDKYVLLPSEQAEVKAATDRFNIIIKNAADQAGLAFVDANKILTELGTNGIRFDNYHMSSAFVTGGAFSLDGIHLTARANAYIANQFLTAINNTYGSTFKMLKPGNYPISYPSFIQ